MIVYYLLYQCSDSFQLGQDSGFCKQDFNTGCYVGCVGGEARYRSIEEGFGEGSLELTRLTVLDGLSCPP